MRRSLMVGNVDEGGGFSGTAKYAGGVDRPGKKRGRGECYYFI